MTTEEQRNYWEERYNIEEKKNKRLINDFEALIKEMLKDGNMYWAGRIIKIIDK